MGLGLTMAKCERHNQAGYFHCATISTAPLWRLSILPATNRSDRRRMWGRLVKKIINLHNYVTIFYITIIVVFLFSYGLLCQSDAASYRIMLNYKCVYIYTYTTYTTSMHYIESSWPCFWRTSKLFVAEPLEKLADLNPKSTTRHFYSSTSTTIIRPSPSLSSTSGCLEALKRAWVA